MENITTSVNTSSSGTGHQDQRGRKVLPRHRYGHRRGINYLVICLSVIIFIDSPSISVFSHLTQASTPRLNQLSIFHEPVHEVWNPLLNEVTFQGDEEALSIRARDVLRRPSRRDNQHVPHTGHQNRNSIVDDEMWTTSVEDDLGIQLLRPDVYATPLRNADRDNEWLVEVGYGTPQQKLKVVLDSGSSGGWLYSPHCCYGSNHSYFDPHQSSTWANRTLNRNGVAMRARPNSTTPGTPWNATYGSALSTTSGYVGFDTLHLTPTLEICDVNLALATSLNGTSRTKRKMEGIIGLLPSRTVTKDFPGGWNTPIEKAIRDGRLAEPFVSIVFEKADRRTAKGGGGRYVFGGIDVVAKQGPITWIDVKSQTFWGINFKTYSMGTGADYVNLTDPDDTHRRLILDTGTALILVSPPAADAINSLIYGSYKREAGEIPITNNKTAVNGNGNGNGSKSKSASETVLTVNPWLIPCQTGLEEYESQLPMELRTKDFYVELNGVHFSIPISDFPFWPLSPLPSSLSGGRKDMCLSAFQPTSAGYSVLGGVFFKNALVVLDHGDSFGVESHRRVGVARRRDLDFP